MAQLFSWNARYSEDKIPLEGPGDSEWLAEGQQLLHRTRAALGAGYRVDVTESWWGEEET